MSKEMRIYSKVYEVPENAKKPIQGGRLNGMTNINPMWRIKELTEVFGPCGTGWYFKPIKREFVEGANGVVAVFVDIELYYYEDGKLSEPLPGTGGSMFVSKESKGLYTDDEAIKKATTDAISSAAKLLGVGGMVYWEQDTTKYDEKGEVIDTDAELNKATAVFEEAAKKAGLDYTVQNLYFHHVYKTIFSKASVEQIKKATKEVTPLKAIKYKIESEWLRLKLKPETLMPTIKKKYDIDYGKATIEQLEKILADMLKKKDEEQAKS